MIDPKGGLANREVCVCVPKPVADAFATGDSVFGSRNRRSQKAVVTRGGSADSAAPACWSVRRSRVAKPSMTSCGEETAHASVPEGSKGGEMGGFGGGELEHPRQWLGAQRAGLSLGVLSCP